ncbi:MAG: hypothetical protein WD069_10145 [Planctomycetales bacterium]
MKEYELFVPLRYNDGSTVESRKIERIGERLLDQFGGVTFFPQPNEGSWKMGHVTFHDEIVIFRVLTSNARVARRFFRQLKADLKEDLRQEEILIVEKDAEVL